MSSHVMSLKTYWTIWFYLLVLTLAMLAVEAAAFPPILAVLALLLAMFVKATLIAGWFMHLRFERMSLTLSLVLGTILTSAFLYFLIVPDGIRMLELAP